MIRNKLITDTNKQINGIQRIHYFFSLTVGNKLKTTRVITRLVLNMYINCLVMFHK